METKIYIVKNMILRNGIWYQQGEKIELTEKERQELIDALVPDPFSDSVLVLIPTKEDAHDDLSTSASQSPATSAETEAQEETVKTARKGTAKL